jgi:hypothetical protein
MPKRRITKAKRAEYARRAKERKRGTVSVEQVKAEGVVEFGRVEDTSVLYVLTKRGIRLFHAETLDVGAKRAA